MRTLLVSAVILSMGICQYADACGGGGRGGKIAFGGRSSGFDRSPIVSNFSPQNQMIAMAQGQINMARQAAAMQAIAYNNQMRPIRMANAARVRQMKIARREARKTIMLAKLEQKRRVEQEFLARSRSWTDSTGEYQVTAVLADANDWGVKLRKADGSFVTVPMNRLSVPDQTWVVQMATPTPNTDRTMFAGL